MPTLDWIGKQAVVTHHREVPTRLLEPDAALACGSGAESGNLIVQGDNLHALKALLPRYAGQVKCVYIDPPYNTGNEGWVYNDNVNSPEINKWLGETVGKEAEDLCRHDKWLCMMYPRLVLLKQFLREDGSIFISIDDNEVAQLRLLMDEIFGARNFLANVVWEKADSPKMDSQLFSTRHDHTVSYAKNLDKFTLNRFSLNQEDLPAHYNKQDEKGRFYYLKPLRAMMGGEEEKREARPNLYFGIEAPDGKLVYPKLTNGEDGRWRWGPGKVEKEKWRIEWVDGKKGWVPYYRIYADTSNGRPPETIFSHEFAGSSRKAKAELKGLFPEGMSFTTPKPTRLIERILQIASDKDSLILDSFAGSGTTGHAVLKQNAADGGNRRFILVEMEEEIATTITAERIRRVSEGYTDSKGKDVEGLGGGFQFCRLSEYLLFDEFGEIREEVRFAELAEFVWLCETGTGFGGPMDGPLLGTHRGRAIFLLNNGIRKDRTDAGGNVLNARTLEVLPETPEAEERVVYGTRCRFSPERLESLGIEFKQLPYHLRIRT